jgi:hypothetical protein
VAQRKPADQATQDVDDRITTFGTYGVAIEAPGGAIASDVWLHSYTVEFRWTVIRVADGKIWTSPVLVHSVTSTYAGGADVPVDYDPAPSTTLTLNEADFEDPDTD